MKKYVFPALALSAALAGTLAATAPATASSRDRGTVAISSSVSGLSAAARKLDADPAKALAKYWTPARMQSAKSADVVAIRTGADLRGVNKSTSGAPGSVAPSGSAAGKFANRPMPAGYPNWGPNQPTAKTNGKVFFTSGAVNYVCSGAVVNSEGKSTVWTAGHCVSDNQQWNTNWVFVPAYKNGNAPWGVWSARQLWTTSAWFNNNSDFANDVGAAIMYRLGGWRITDRLGGQGIKWNWSRTSVVALGYPQASPFNGQRLYRVNGMTYAYGTDSYMVNYMTGGSSGGPWLREFNGQYGYINGHNDYKYDVWPQYMFSPYYGNQVANLYNATRNLTS